MERFPMKVLIYSANTLLYVGIDIYISSISIVYRLINAYYRHSSLYTRVLDLLTYIMWMNHITCCCHCYSTTAKLFAWWWINMSNWLIIVCYCRQRSLGRVTGCISIFLMVLLRSTTIVHGMYNAAKWTS